MRSALPEAGLAAAFTHMLAEAATHIVLEQSGFGIEVTQIFLDQIGVITDIGSQLDTV